MKRRATFSGASATYEFMGTGSELQPSRISRVQQALVVFIPRDVLIAGATLPRQENSAHGQPVLDGRYKTSVIVNMYQVITEKFYNLNAHWGADEDEDGHASPQPAPIELFVELVPQQGFEDDDINHGTVYRHRAGLRFHLLCRVSPTIIDMNREFRHHVLLVSNHPLTWRKEALEQMEMYEMAGGRGIGSDSDSDSDSGSGDGEGSDDESDSDDGEQSDVWNKGGDVDPCTDPDMPPGELGGDSDPESDAAAEAAEADAKEAKQNRKLEAAVQEQMKSLKREWKRAGKALHQKQKALSSDAGAMQQVGVNVTRAALAFWLHLDTNRWRNLVARQLMIELPHSRTMDEFLVRDVFSLDSSQDDARCHGADESCLTHLYLQPPRASTWTPQGIYSTYGVYAYLSLLFFVVCGRDEREGGGVSV